MLATGMAKREKDPKKPASPFGQAGRSVLSCSALGAGQSRPGTADSLASDQEEDWRQMRAAMKSVHRQSLSEASRSERRTNSIGAAGGAGKSSSASSLTPLAAASPLGEFGSLPPTPLSLMGRSKTVPDSLPGSLPSSPTGRLGQVAVPVKAMHRMRTECLERETAYFERRKERASSHKPEMYESLIRFLEMHNLSRGYALGLAAHGMEELSQLLLADQKELNRAVEGCSMDAMDEILFLEALQTARGT